MTHSFPGELEREDAGLNGGRAASEGFLKLVFSVYRVSVTGHDAAELRSRYLTGWLIRVRPAGDPKVKRESNLVTCNNIAAPTLPFHLQFNFFNLNFNFFNLNFNFF